MKKILSIVLAIVMALPAFSVRPTTALALDEESGQCGGNAYYYFSDEGRILNIVGTGAMYDYAEGESPFSGNTTVDSIDIADGITSIGAYAFYNMPLLRDCITPGSVNEIKEGAFKDDKFNICYVGTEDQWDGVLKPDEYAHSAICYNVRPEVPIFDVTVSDTVYGESTSITVKCPKDEPSEEGVPVTESVSFFIVDETGNIFMSGKCFDNDPESGWLTGSITYPDDLNAIINDPDTDPDTNPDITYSPLDSGTYYVQIQYTTTGGTGKYISRVNYRKPFNVEKKDPNIKITIPEITYGEILYPEIELPKNIFGYANIKLSGSDIDFFDISDNKPTYSFSGLNAGDYTLTFEFFPENFYESVVYPNYNAETVNVDFTVKKADPDFNVSTDEVLTNTDETVINIESNADGLANVTVGSKKIQVSLDEGSAILRGVKSDSGDSDPEEKPIYWDVPAFDGKATVELQDLIYGKVYPYTVEYSGNENYNKKTVGGEIRVIKSGKIGENIDYLLDDGVLSLSGSGGTYNYDKTDNNPSPVDGSVNRLNVEKIVFSNDITSIGNDVFSGILGVNNVFVPADCTVADSAFDSTVNIWRYTVDGTDLTITALEGAKTATQIDCDAVEGCIIRSVTAEGITLNHSHYTLVENVSATCAEQGYSVYRCNACDYVFEGNPVAALNHSWGAAEYTWTSESDSWKCEAKRICTRDASHTENETATVTSQQTKDATCTENGEITYTAAFTNSAFETQTRTVENMEALGHKYGTEGDARFTCTVCGAVDEALKAEVLATPTPAPVTDNAAAEKAAKEKAAAEFIADVSGTSTARAVTVSWGKVPNAKRYIVYAAYCNKNHTFKYKKIKTVKGKVTKYSIKKLYGKKLNPKKSVKAYVEAQDKINGKWKMIFKTPSFHIAGAKGGYSNVKKITVKKSNITLSEGASEKIKAKIVLVNKKKKAVDHERKLRFVSANTSVATVSKSGMIKATGIGETTIFVYSNNGTAKAIKVTVR